MNEEQQEAVLSLSNTLLIAGAGSGKTFTIINKINYLLDNNIYKEDELLIISFTNESVNDLKRKINYNIDIKTFHKLSLDLIHTYNLKIAKDNMLSYIIDEYFNSYLKDHFKAKIRIKRLLLENTKDNLKKLIMTFINLYKCNNNDIDKLINLVKQSKYIKKDYYLTILEIYLIYNNELKSSGYVDFNDMIIMATNKINNNEVKTKYKFIMIDEFQDTSLIRLNLIKAILNQNNGTIFAVGDDYQSIYRFSGCNLNVFIHLDKYIDNLKIIKLKYNYRNSQTLITISNNFIAKNKNQLLKNSKCPKDLNKPIKIIYYVNKSKVINKLINNIDTNILILGRNNKDILSWNITLSDKIKYLTIHKSKGLEEDNVILINLENSNHSMPTKTKDHQIISEILNQNEYPYEEERRLFYVALTRTRNYIYLLVPKNNPSIFIKELIKDNKKDIEIIHNY